MSDRQPARILNQPKTPRLPAFLVVCLLCVAAAFPLAAQEAEPRWEPQLRPDTEEPRERLKHGATELGKTAGRKLTEFAGYADSFFEEATNNRLVGWGLFAGALTVGLASMLYGWAVMQVFLIPFAPFWGVITGGGIAFCMIAALYSEREVWFKLLLLAVGVAMGFGLYLFSALRAKPVAALLVIMSPFLLIAAFLFPVHDKLGLAIFAAGFLAGFAAMIEVRPLAIVATSILGACAVLSGVSLLSHLIGDQVEWLSELFNWLVVNPLMLAIVLAVLAFIAANYQFITGPRGPLAE